MFEVDLHRYMSEDTATLHHCINSIDLILYNYNNKQQKCECTCEGILLSASHQQAQNHHDACEKYQIVHL